MSSDYPPDERPIDEPVDGNVTDYEWVAPDTILVTVTKGDRTFTETYEFVEGVEHVEPNGGSS